MSDIVAVLAKKEMFSIAFWTIYRVRQQIGRFLSVKKKLEVLDIIIQLHL